MIDLMSAVQAAVYAALAARVPPEVAEAFDTVPEGTLGSYVQVGAIDSANEGSKGEQAERFEVEVNSIYLGKDRGVLLAIMHAAREALDGEEISADGVSFSTPEFLSAAAGATPVPTPKGLLYAGISSFEIYAEPAD